jgi:hypothetical protein
MLLPAGLQLERARSLLGDPSDITTDDIKEFIGESERGTRKFAHLVLPLLLVASTVLLWLPVYVLWGPPDTNFWYYVGTASISQSITLGFGYWRYAGLTFRRTILFGVVNAVVGFASAHEIVTTLARGGFDLLFVWRWWCATFGVVSVLGISAIFVPLMRRISVWLPLLIVGNVPPLALALLHPVGAYLYYFVAILWMGVLGFLLRRGAT